MLFTTFLSDLIDNSNQAECVLDSTMFMLIYRHHPRKSLCFRVNDGLRLYINMPTTILFLLTIHLLHLFDGAVGDASVASLVLLRLPSTGGDRQGDTVGSGSESW